MNKKNILIFAAGAATGSVLGWIFAKKHYEKVATIVFSDDQSLEPTIPAPEIVEPEEAQKYSGWITIDNVEAPDTEEKEEEMAISPSEGMEETPYPIDIETFCETEIGFEKVTLTYYKQDNVLLDEMDGELDPEDTIGDNVAYLQESPETEAVYIRNESMATDYEIIIRNSAYADVPEYLGYGRYYAGNIDAFDEVDDPYDI